MDKHAEIKVTGWGEQQPGERTINKAVSFYPNQLAIVKAFANMERRTFSNAVQVIVEQWYDDHIKDFITDEERAAAHEQR